MTRPTEAPKLAESNRWGDKYTHRAFGSVTVHQWHAHPGVRLFGSDLVHSSGISICFRAADLHRDLSHDRPSSGEVLLEIEMSEAQWARFVSSQGNGDGNPVTIAARRNGNLEQPPMIAAPEATKREVHGEEMAAALRDRLVAMEEHIAALGSMIDSGKVSRTGLRELHKELARHCGQLPGSVQFVYDQFSRATEQVAEDAKVEVEAFVSRTAQRLGFERLADMAPLLSNRAARVDASDGDVQTA